MGDPRDGFTFNEDGTPRGESYSVAQTRKKAKNQLNTKSTTVPDGGGGQNYYDLPPNPKQLQDLIEYVNMNGNLKDIFKSCYRSGKKDGTSEEYDARKRVYYSLRELGRLLGRKDYITLSKEVIKHQAEEDV